MSEPTHIRLTCLERDEAAAILLPIATSTFELSSDFTTIAITGWGRVYRVQESIADIEEALSVVRRGDAT